VLKRPLRPIKIIKKKVENLNGAKGPFTPYQKKGHFFAKKRKNAT